MIRAIIACVVIYAVGFIGGCRHAHASELVRAVLNEAEGEPYQSKLAHAFLFVNRERTGMTLGSSGLYSEKVRARLARVPASVRRDAERAVDCAVVGCVPDPTRGAVHCENVRAFGVPKYIQRGLRAGIYEESARVGDVTFWRIKK